MLATKQRGARWRATVKSFGSALAALAIFALASPALAVDPTYNQEQLKKAKKKKGTEAELKQAAEEKRPWFFDAIASSKYTAAAPRP